MFPNYQPAISGFTSPRPRPPASSPPRAVAATLLLGIALALSGCATPMLKSTVEVPEQFMGATAGETADAVAQEVAWWKSYGDPVLSGLIEHAARQNRDVRIAAERVRAARAGQKISQSWLLPNLGLSAGRSKSSNGYDGAAQLAAPEVDSRSAGIDVSWEIDLTGRLRDGVAAAKADTLATEDAARGVRLLVLTDVASSYFTLTGALRQLETMRAISAAQDRTLQLVTARQRVGLASAFDVERARTDADRVRAAIPPLETLVVISRHRIAVLCGDQPKDAAAIQPWNGVVSVPTIVPGQPAALLERRPDLLALQAQLESANWRRRQAATEWFPRLFISGLFGGQDTSVNGIGLGNARFGNVAGLLAMPLLNWGRTRADNEIASAGQNEAQLRYEDAIVRALEDVENALVALRDTRQRSTYLASAAGSADSALRRAQSLYDRGQIDLLPLLDAQRAQLQVRMEANNSDTELLLGSVRLFKALGGGWQAFEPSTAVTDATTTNKDPS